MSDFIYDLMKQVNNFILRESPISHYIEWAKKAECWLAVQSNKWAYNLDEIRQDFIDEKIHPNATIKMMLKTKSRTNDIRKASYGPFHSPSGRR